MQVNNLDGLSSVRVNSLNKAISQTQNLLIQFTSNPNFNLTIETAFGRDRNLNSLENWRQDLLDNNLSQLPNIEIRSSQELAGANAAFSIDTNIIYLSEEYLEENEWDNSIITNLLLEESGHWLDSQINVIDADGDEGSIFASLLLGNNLTDTELVNLKNEDDSASIILDGEVVNIEQHLADNQQANTIFNHPTLTSEEIILLSKFALFSYYGNDGNYENQPDEIDLTLSDNITLKNRDIVNLNKLNKDEQGNLLKTDKLFEDSEINDWEIITSQLGISLVNGIEIGDTYRKEVHRNRPLIAVEVDGTTETYGIDGIVDADAFVAKRKSDGALVVSIRGTEFGKDNRDWLHKDEHYELFDEFFAGLDSYIQNNNPPKVYLTGHSLGAAMVDRFMAERRNDSLFSAVTFASPEATFDKTDDRVLNIGYENDPVYSVVGTSDLFNSTTNFYVSLDSEHSKDEKGNDSGFLSEHSMFGYVYATSRILNSKYYTEIDRDSFITTDLTDDLEDGGLFDIFRLQSDNILGSPDTFILGEDNRDDTLIGGRGDDLLEALGGNDSLVGDDGIFDGDDTLDGGEGNDTLDGDDDNDLLIGGTGNDVLNGGDDDDTLDGGDGNDTLDGGDGDDVAVFANNRELYTISPDYTKVTHNILNEENTLSNIEILQFNDEPVFFYKDDNIASFIPKLDSYLGAIEAFLMGGSDDVPNEFKSSQGGVAGEFFSSADEDINGQVLSDEDSNNPGIFELELPFIGDSLGELQDSLEVIRDLRGLIANEFKGEIALTAEQIANKLSDIDGLTVTKTSETNDEVKFALSLDIVSDPFTIDLAPDLGQLSALGINIDGETSVDVGLNISGLEFGVNDSGAFITQNDSALEVTLGLGLPTGNLSAGLGCLGIDLHSTLPENLDFKFDVPLNDFNYDLDFSQLNKLELFNFDFALPNLSLPGLAPITLPEIRGGIDLDFRDLGNLNFGDGEDLEIPFNLDNIELDLGSFYNEFLRPITSEIQDILDPLQPFLDVINQEIPGLSDFDSVRRVFDENGDGRVTMLDFAYYLDPTGGYQFLEELIAYNDFINSIPSDGGMLDLGDLVYTPGTDDNDSDVTDGFDLELPSNYDSLKPNIPNRPSGFTIPLLDSPETVIPRLLLGDPNPADLITYTMPPLEFNSQFEQFFPLVGPLGVRFAGELGARAQFSFGFDTYGIGGCDDGFHSGDILQGFYVSDIYDGVDIPEANIYAGVALEGGADFGVARGFVGGNLRGNVDFNLYDPNGDGKIRPYEFDPNPINLFDISANLTAGIQAWAEVGFKILGKKFTKRIIDERWGPFTLWSQELTSRPIDPNLGYVNAGTLALNDGDNRSVGGGQINESYQISQSGGSLQLTGYGHQESFSGVNEIVAAGGEGSDRIELLANVNTTANIDGGIGEDTIYGGGVNDNLAGGDGNDSLFGRDGGDNLTGDAGLDTILGGPGNDNLDGGNGNDKLYGEVGNDSLDGGNGNDEIAGGDNSDFLQGQSENDILYGESGNDTLYGGTDNDTLIGGGGKDSLNGEAGNDSLNGGIGRDKIIGGDGNDTLIGREGDDNLDGGSGNDSIEGGRNNDTIIGSFGDDSLYGHEGNDSLDGGSGNDILNVYNYSGTNTLQGGSGDDSLYGGTGIDNLQGNTGEDYLHGYGDNDVIDGGVEPDTVYGGGGHDVIYGGEDNDLLSGDSGIDAIEGGEGDDTIRGGIGNDSLLQGDEGEDFIQGEAGDDTIHGGMDNDIIDGGADNDFITGDEGRDAIAGGIGNDNIDGGIDSDTLQGGDGADTIVAGEGNDTIEGGKDNDSVMGGEGRDTILGEDGSDTIEGGAGDDVIESGADNDSVMGNSGNDAIQGGRGNDIVSGGADRDTIAGEDGADSLSGDEGEDTITGGTGNDTIAGGIDSDLVRGEAGEDALQGDAGDDTIEGGTEPDNIAGNAGIDNIFGDAGNDTIDGGEGTDFIVGGVGEDTIYGDFIPGNDSSAVGEDTIYGGYDNDIIAGQNSADVLYGEEGDDSITGGAENDLIEGGQGQDTLEGGEGEDTIYGQEGDDRIDGGTNKDTLEGEAGDDSITGGQGDDSIVGGQGNDTLDGGTENDRLTGNEGSDRLFGAKGNDTLEGGVGEDFIQGGEGDDSIEAGAGDDSVEGQAHNDIITGGQGKDTLQGGVGRDNLDGGTGNDLLIGDETNDPNFATDYDNTVRPTNYDDTLKGGEGDDSLYGYLGHDELHAGRGENWLEGGFGKDTLYGTTDDERLETPEGEIDRSVFALAPGSGRDIIHNFNPTEDVIYLSQGLTFAFLGIESTTYEEEASTNLIDLDTGDILATLVGIDPSQISRSNVDEENVPPNRLEFDSKKEYYATDETISLVDTVIRDANTIDDLETIDFWLRQNDGEWSDIADIGFKGIDGTAQWADYDEDGDEDLLIAGINPKTGSYHTKIYNQNNGNFSEADLTLPTSWLNRMGWTWGDYDGDDDLDILGYGYVIENQSTDSTVAFSEDYIDILPDFDLIGDGDVEWQDYDGDGNIDILVSGSGIDGNNPVTDYTRIYYNDGNGNFNTFDDVTDTDNIEDVRENGTVTKVNDIVAETDFVLHSADWYDYNQDGNIDLIVTGAIGTEENAQAVTRIYDGDGAGNFTENTQHQLPGVINSDVVWGEDNNGNVYLLVTGQSNEYRTRAEDFDRVRIPISKIYHYDDQDFNELENNNLLGVYHETDGNHITLEDYDSDGDLDITLTGKDFFDNPATIVYRNENDEFVNATFDDPASDDPRLGTFEYEIDNSNGDLAPGDYELKGTAYDHETASEEYTLIPGSGEREGNRALYFDGEDDYVEIPDSEAINFDTNESFTIEVWIKADPEQVDLEFSSNSIIEKWSRGGEGYPFILRYNNQDHAEAGKIDVARFDSNVAPHLFSQSTIDDGEFHHVAFVKDDDWLYLYVDGVLEASREDVSIASTKNTSPLYLGSRGDTSIGNHNFFKGAIDDVRVWNIARTPEEVQANYDQKLTGDEAGLAGYWKFDEGSSSIADDSSSNTNNGTVNGAIPTNNLSLEGSRILEQTQRFGSFDQSAFLKETLIDSQDNVYLVGRVNSDDIWVSRYDRELQNWTTQEFGSTENDGTIQVSFDNQDNLYLAGYTYGDFDGAGSGTHAGNRDVWVAKYDNNTQNWTTRQFGSTQYDDISKLIKNSDGKIYIAGITQDDIDGAGSGTHAGSNDIWIADYDESTDNWVTEQFGSTETDFLDDSIIDNEGNIYLAGYTYGDFDRDGAGAHAGGTSSNYDIWITRHDDSTDAWTTKQFGSTEHDFPHEIITDSGENTYLAGTTRGDFDRDGSGTHAGESDVWIVRYNDSTNNWTTEQFGSSSWDYVHHSFVDSQGNAYFAGQTSGDFDRNGVGTHVGGSDIWMMRYDVDGNSTIQQFGSTNSDYVNAITSDNEGNVYVTGTTRGDIDGSGSLSHAGSDDIWIAKYNAQGDQVWLEQFGSTEYDHVQKIVTDSQGNVYLSGDTSGDIDGGGVGVNHGSPDIWVARYDRQTETWSKQQFGSTYSDSFKDIVVDAEDNVYITGTKNVSYEENLWVIKYDNQTDQWIDEELESGDRELSPSIVTGSQGNAYLTSTTEEGEYSYTYDPYLYSGYGNFNVSGKYFNVITIAGDQNKEKFILGDSETSFYGLLNQPPILIEKFQGDDQIQLHGSDLQYHFATIQVATDGSVTYANNNTSASIDESTLLTPDLIQTLTGKTATLILYSATGWTSISGEADPNNGEHDLVGVVAGVETLKKTTQAEEGNVVFVSERNDFTEKTNFSINTNGTADSEALLGGDNKDILTGGDGDDTIISYQGSDYIDGGTGEDILIGTTDELPITSQSIRWQDYDGDGDEDIILLDSQNDDRELTQVYRNNGELNPEGIVSFTYLNNEAIPSTLPEQFNTGVVYHLWGEDSAENADNNEYIYLSSNGANEIHLKDGENYTPVNFNEDNNEDPFLDLNAHSFDWGDYNNDNNIDFVVTGQDTRGFPVTRVYQGDGNANFTKQDNFNFDDVVSGDAAWGDYDGDGDDDLIVIGNTLGIVNTGGGFEVVEEAIAKLYQYDSENDTFAEDNTFFDLAQLNIDPELLNLNHTRPVDYIGWGDYDRDGKLDLILSDRATTTQVHRNLGDHLDFATTPFFDDTTVSEDENLIFGWEDSDRIWGGSGDDIIKAKSGDDTVQGGTGNDTIFGGEGADLIDGGSDRDFLTYQEDPDGVKVNLTPVDPNPEDDLEELKVIATDGYNNTDTIVITDGVSSIENAIATEYQDILVGDSQKNKLIGLAGDDNLAGEAGEDTLVGGLGNDIIQGGEGNDLIQSGSGKDDLQGGDGDDEYVLIPAITTLHKTDGDYPEKVYLSLEEAFTALGGGHKQQGKIIRPSNNFEINWDTFTRWHFDAEFDKFIEFGFKVDEESKERRNNGDDNWLSFEPRQALAGTQITDANGDNDELILPGNIAIDLERLYPGKTGLAQVGTSLVIDLNEDGVTTATDDIYIHNFFDDTGYGKGTGFIEQVHNRTGDEIINNLAQAFTPVAIPLPEYSDTKNWSSFTTWGDYNDDGKLDAFVTGEDDLGNGFAKIYRNANTDSSKFTDDLFVDAVDIEALERVKYVKWGDYDNDGDVDLLLLGHDNLPLTDETEQPAREYFARVYRNNHLENKQNGDAEDVPFIVTESISLGQIDKTDENNVDLPTVDWADYDNDGDLDILTTGHLENETDFVNIYSNIEDDFDLENPQQIIDRAFFGGSVDSIDYNNDGRIDIAVTGINNNATEAIKLYQQQDDGSYLEFADLPVGVTNSTAAWGDYNNNGYFDLAVAGERKVTGNALQLDGVDDYVEIPDSDAIDFDTNENFTIETWVKADPIQYEQPSPNHSIIHKWGAGNSPYSFAIQYDRPSGRVTTGRYDGENSSGMASKSVINDGEFHHVAYVKNGNRLYLYVDGVLENQRIDNSVSSTANNSPIYIGQRGINNNFFTGEVDDVRIWNKPRTEAEIQADMDRLLEGDEAGLVGYWNFNTIADNNVEDLSSNNNNGTVSGATFTTGVEQVKEVTELYNNDGNNLQLVTTSFTNLSDPSLSWGDYDNDGNLDLLVTGTNNHQPITEIYRGDGAGNFTILEDNEFLTTSVQNGEATWGDYDNDGDLDIAIAGAAGRNGVPFAQVYRNNHVETGEDSETTDEDGNILETNANQSPKIPSKRLPKYTDDSVTLRWNPTTDNPTSENKKTPQDALTYNLRIGTSTGGVDVLAPASRKTKGERQVVTIGNVGFAGNEVINDEVQSTLTWTIDDLDYGETYYWNVQAIDGGLQASAWDSEANFTVNFVDWSQGEPNTTIDLPSKPGQDFVDDENDLPGINVVDFEVGDYNNDGKLDLVVVGQDATNNDDGLIRIYQGTSVTEFNWNDEVDPVEESFSDTTFSDVSLGDFNSYQNDGGYLDLLIVAEKNNLVQDANFSGVYINQNGSFDFTQDLIDIGNIENNQTHTYTKAEFGDYDNDGDLDILLGGLEKSLIIGNDRFSSNNGYQTSTKSNLIRPQREVLDTNWVDYDNDGDLDAVLSLDVVSGTNSKKATEFYSNETYISTNGNSQSISTIFSRVSTPYSEGAVEHIGQYNKEGTLDFILDDGKIYANKITSENTVPIPPNELNSNVDNDNKLVTFDWSAGSDDLTDAKSLTYNLRVGSTPEGSDIVAPVLIDGWGNAQTNTSWQLNLPEDINDGLYYWSVQAVDNAFATSEFSTEGTFYLGEQENKTPESEPDDSTIDAPDIAPTITINDLVIQEGNEGTEAIITVSLNIISEAEIEIDYTTTDDTATAESDYSTTSGTLTFAPGETTKDITIPIVGDTEAESDSREENEIEELQELRGEAFVINLDNARYGANALDNLPPIVTGKNQSTVRIADDDHDFSDLTIADSSLKILDANSNEVTSVQQGDTFSLEWELDNNGEGETLNPPYFQIYLSEDDILNGDDLFLGDLQGETTLAAATSTTFSRELQIVEEEVGDRNLIVVIDPEYEQTLDDGSIILTGNEAETNEDNNIVNKAISITPIPDAETIDISISNGAINSVTSLNPTVSWSLINPKQETVDVITYMYLSEDLELDSGDVQVFPNLGEYLIPDPNDESKTIFDNDTFLSDNTISLNPNQINNYSQSIDFAERTEASKYLLLFTSSQSDLLETNIEDNLLAISIPSIQEGTDNDDLLEGDIEDNVLNGRGGNDTLIGNEGDDSLNGGLGHDTLNGGEDDDTLIGEEGNDKLYGKEGRDLFYGGTGNDYFSGHEDDDTLHGGEGLDTLNGGAGNDILYGELNNDTLNGGTGNDTISESTDNNLTLTDTQLIGKGNDNLTNIESAILNGNYQSNLIDASAASQINVTLSGGSGDDTLLGGSQNDLLSGYNDDDSLSGGLGNDTLNSGNGDDTLIGDEGSDSLIGGAGDDTLNSGLGDDSLDGGNDNDKLYGKEGADILKGSAGDDYLSGHNDDDTLYGGDGIDTLNGGAGDDILYGGFGDDTINGNSGNDTISESTDNNLTLTDTQLVGKGDDNLTNIESAILNGNHQSNLIDASDASQINVTLSGGSGDDTLLGGSRNDLLSGYNDNDSLNGGLGNDTLNSGNGDDTLIGDEGSDSLIGGAGDDTLNSGLGDDSLDGGDDNDKLYGKEGSDLLIGGAGDDYLSGHNDDDTLYGGDGIDTLNGGAGDDILYGGLGDDILTGNSGIDIIALETTAGTDTINSFKDGEDFLGLTGSLSFDNLSVNDNLGDVLIADNNNNILAIITNFSVLDLTVDDFINI